MRRNSYILMVIYCSILGCSQSQNEQDHFRMSFNYFISSLNEEKVSLEIVSKFIDLDKPQIPLTYSFIFPQLIDEMGYSKMELKYKYKNSDFEEIKEDLEINSKLITGINPNFFQFRYLNNWRMPTYHDSSAVIPDLWHDSFFFDGFDSSKGKLFVLEYSDGNTISSKLLTKKQLLKPAWDHGYSFGAVTDSTTNQIIYWLLAW